MAANRKDVPTHYYTLEEYFALERAGDSRFEYWNGDIVCMSGGPKAHYRISRNVIVRLQLKLDGGNCEAFTAEMPIKTPVLPPYRYPDVTIGCGKLEFESISGIDALINPILIVEVTSPSTETHDRNEKFEAYKMVSTFQEYLLVSQEDVHVTHHVKQLDGKWLAKEFTDLNATLQFNSIDCSLSMSEIYRGVRFDEVNK